MARRSAYPTTPPQLAVAHVLERGLGLCRFGFRGKTVHALARPYRMFLLQRLHQMIVNLDAGVFPVRWMPDAAYGLGYPFFNHYSALPFYLASFFGLLGLDFLTALKLTQTLGFLIAALAMYGWVLRLWGNRAAAWLAAIAYTVAPFHVVNVYVRGDSLSEFFAFIFYPFDPPHGV